MNKQLGIVLVFGAASWIWCLVAATYPDVGERLQPHWRARLKLAMIFFGWLALPAVLLVFARVGIRVLTQHIVANVKEAFPPSLPPEPARPEAGQLSIAPQAEEGALAVVKEKS